VRAEAEIRREAVVLGPGKPGFVKLRLGRRRGYSDERIDDVPFDRIPAPLRLPNTRVVTVMGDGGVLRVEADAVGRPRLDVEARVRRVLNEWDPIGVAGEVEDEYDGYINGVLGLLGSGASERAIAGHLLAIEQERMELPGAPLDRLLSVASRLRSLRLPDDAGRGPS
jgi:hypothetical protein